MPIERIAILGTGLIGSSIGLALRAHGFSGSIAGWDPNPGQVHVALRREAITVIADDPLAAVTDAQLVILGGPVFTILEWLDRLASVLRDDQLVTDVGSVKGALCGHARGKYNGPDQPGFLPGHPMAGKEVSGAENADADLFDDAVWLFTPWNQAEGSSHRRGGAGRPGLALLGRPLRLPRHRSRSHPPRRPLRLDQPSPAIRLHRDVRAPRR